MAACDVCLLVTVRHPRRLLKPSINTASGEENLPELTWVWNLERNQIHKRPRPHLGDMDWCDYESFLFYNSTLKSEAVLCVLNGRSIWDTGSFLISFGSEVSKSGSRLRCISALDFWMSRVFFSSDSFVLFRVFWLHFWVGMYATGCESTVELALVYKVCLCY